MYYDEIQCLSGLTAFCVRSTLAFSALFYSKMSVLETVSSLSVACRSTLCVLSVARRPTDNQQSVEGSSSSQLPNLLRFTIYYDHQQLALSIVGMDMYFIKNNYQGHSL